MIWINFVDATLGKRLEAYNSAIEYVEDLVTAKDDTAKDRAINRLSDWAKPWRAVVE